ncbi:MAG: phosphodiester glycosidase family protein [Nocardioides sp.]
MIRPTAVLARATAAVLTTLLVALATGTPVSGDSSTLPLGDADLVEIRSTEVLAEGVTLTRITRGFEPAAEKDIGTTTRGPWRVNVLTIDPAVAAGSLQASYGSDLATVEPVGAIASASGALAAVNASFFTFTEDERYPGDPVGVGLYGGTLLSEPSTVSPAEVVFLVDSRTNQARMDKLTWQGQMVNRRSRAALPLEFLNHRPVVPRGCRDLKNPRRCFRSGDVVRFASSFADKTPKGPGVEVVLGRHGCVVRREMTRGTELKPQQSSVQATGRQSVRLLRLTQDGCLAFKSVLRDTVGNWVETGDWMSGVNGRFRLTVAGRSVVPRGTTELFERNPRTIAGRTREGVILLVTIDGRQSTSVGTTLDETAAVALSLGMRNAVNLDGGGSTTMVANGALVNTPSGDGQERAVGDALVFVPAP